MLIFFIVICGLIICTIILSLLRAASDFDDEAHKYFSTRDDIDNF